jgi:hypothetical protein
VWGPADRNPWITLVGATLIQRGHTPGGDPFGPGGLFSLAEAERNMDVARDIGFGDIAVEEMSGAMEIHDLDDYWGYQTSISGLVPTAPPDEQDALRATFRSVAEPYRTADGYQLPYSAVILHATR